MRVFNFLFSYALLHGLLLLCSHANSRANPLHSSQAALKAFLLIILKYRLCCTLLPLQPQFRLWHVEEKTCWVKSVCFVRNLLFCCRCLPDVVSTGLVQKKKRTESVGLFDCWQKHYMYISTCICLDIRGKLHYNYFMIRDYYCTVRIQTKKDPIKMFSG